MLFADRFIETVSSSFPVVYTLLLYNFHKLVSTELKLIKLLFIVVATTNSCPRVSTIQLGIEDFL